MYIQNLLNLLPLASLAFSSYIEEHEDERLWELGNLTPYRAAPAFPVEADLPDDCSVDRVMMLHRHGSRGTGSPLEQDLIDSLVQKLEEGYEAIQDAYLPENLRFLKKGYEFNLEPEQLSIIGRQQLFHRGVEFGLKYSDFNTKTLLSSNSQRVIDSMYFFAQGRFGLEAEDKELLIVEDPGRQVSWITPWNKCYPDPYYALKVSAEWSAIYLPPITARLNKFLPPSVNLTDDDTHGALYACPYDLAAGNKAPWCDVFYADELAAFEYELDLIMDAGMGYLAPNNSGRVMGSVFVNKLIERFSDESEEAQSLYLEFGHDGTIIAAMAAMELNRDDPPLSPQGPPIHRKFRTSYQTPFAANMVWERFTCEESFEGPQIRLVLNEETYPLSTCATSLQDSNYGTCSLEAFIQANDFSTSIEPYDATWNAACGIEPEGLYVQGNLFPA